MIAPDTLQALNEEDTKQAKEFEAYVDDALRKSPYFGVDLPYGVCNPAQLNVPARIWLHVLRKYVAAGWAVDPELERGLFAPPVTDDNGSTQSIISLRAAAKR